MKALLLLVSGLAWLAAGQPNRAEDADLVILGYRRCPKSLAQKYNLVGLAIARATETELGNGTVVSENLRWWESLTYLQSSSLWWCMFAAERSKIEAIPKLWVQYPLPGILLPEKKNCRDPSGWSGGRTIIRLALLKHQPGIETNALIIPAEAFQEAHNTLGLVTTCMSSKKDFDKQRLKHRLSRLPDLNDAPPRGAMAAKEKLDYLSLETEEGFGRPPGLAEMDVPPPEVRCERKVNAPPGQVWRETPPGQEGESSRTKSLEPPNKRQRQSEDQLGAP